MNEFSSVLLSELANQFALTLIGEDIVVSGVSSLQNATRDKISFFSNAKLLPDLLSSDVGAVLVKNAEGLPPAKTYLVCSDPALYFAKIAQFFHPLPVSAKSIHPTAVIAPTAKIAQGVEIAAHVVVEDGVVIADGVQLKAGAFVGKNTTVGENTIVMPRVVIYENTVIGKKCLIHSGAVIGSDGFGNAWAGDHWERIPQIGRVVIGDDVEIGANTTIDRGALDDTVIDSGVRLDNLIQIAHNVKIGSNTAIAACTGIAGSTEVGKNCLIGGGVLIAGHIKIADRITILAGSGVPNHLDDSGVYASGVPVVPHSKWLRNMVQFRKLDELAKKIKILEKNLSNKQLEKGEDCDAN
ncbi:UDP-3-O-(3-hydroxymyristoyl)glucosamine N-acyltransferase [Chitinibacter bivalviorum]|uniref:UDP-3-O-acylglucosamine N-acyltransferase n=1 Tax=Chitinibacter bivalviorum TaxID=2739434 RepID=A0A7H9BGN4_9NEIS|nr:UDP-3-O-(3-hydroxymyristoyl)glucosamine N-acyltransferase [Chitinibacter bivalviorum]QLG87883.1 UDP-3-O-(3-hydroxymyristoyl)glucosamine N-acyltransferase [Chitinibacter bivalviorum]